MNVKVLAAAMLCPMALLGAQSAGNTGSSRPGIDVLHYDFSVSLGSRAMPDTIAVTTVVTAARTARVSELVLDLVANMHVNAVSVNGATAAFSHADGRLQITLPRGGSDTLRVAVSHKGVPTDGLIVRRDSLGYWTAFADHFPNRAQQWLPVVDHPSDKATVEWVVRAPSSHRVIANGNRIEESPESGAAGQAGMTVTRWRSVQPLYTAVMVIGVAPFATWELGRTACSLSELPGCVDQSVWITPDVRDYMPGPFAKVGEMVSLFARMVGPFPYEKLAHVQSSTRYGGMENASAIFYADGIYRRRSMSEGLLAHEIAHQWFGDAVTTKEWPHVWLSEGFATYFAELWTENTQGDSAFRAAMDRMRTTALRNPISQRKAIVDRTLNDVSQVLNSNVYQKAGFVLHMLRAEVGDSAFFRGVRSYYMAHRHGNALTSDLQAKLEASSGKKLDWFFSQWLDRPGAPDVEINWRWEGVRRQIVLTVSQKGPAEPYRLNLSMDVTDSKGTVHRVRTTIPASRVSTQQVPLRLDGEATAVSVDPDVTFLGTLTARPERR